MRSHPLMSDPTDAEKAAAMAWLDKCIEGEIEIPYMPLEHARTLKAMLNSSLPKTAACVSPAKGETTEALLHMPEEPSEPSISAMMNGFVTSCAMSVHGQWEDAYHALRAELMRPKTKTVWLFKCGSYMRCCDTIQEAVKEAEGHLGHRMGPVTIEPREVLA